MFQIVTFSDLNVSNSSVVAPLMCDGMFNNNLIANLLLNLSATEFRKLVRI